jgi:hypothetical protein
MKITALITAILAASIAPRAASIADSCKENAIISIKQAICLIDDPEDYYSETYSLITLDNGAMWAINPDDYWHAAHIDTAMIVHDDPDDSTKWALWNIDQDDIHSIDCIPVIMKKGCKYVSILRGSRD